MDKPRAVRNFIKFDKRGYVLQKAETHPAADYKGYVCQHRLVAEEKLGRFLKSNEVVHHVNEIKHDNRPKNLQVMTQADHIILHCPKFLLGGEMMTYCDAAKKLQVGRSSIFRYRKKHEKTIQQAIDHYAKGTPRCKRT